MGRSINPDGGNSDSVRLPCEGDSERLRKARVGNHRSPFRSGKHSRRVHGKTVEGSWDSVETIAYDSHLRDNTTRVICENLENSITGHLPANLSNSGAGGHKYYAGGLRGYPSPSGWEGTTFVCLSCER